MPLVRMTYCWPERLRTVQVIDNRGKTVSITEREPGSPTREARPWELNSWLEDVPSKKAE